MTVTISRTIVCEGHNIVDNHSNEKSNPLNNNKKIIIITTIIYKIKNDSVILRLITIISSTKCYLKKINNKIKRKKKNQHRVRFEPGCT